jgi:hypothetical protein
MSAFSSLEIKVKACISRRPYLQRKKMPKELPTLCGVFSNTDLITFLLALASELRGFNI